MAIRQIRLFGDPVLRTPAGPVVDFDKELRKLVKDLTDTMLDANGAGLAAPQIGVRIAPGATTLTRMPRGDSSDAMIRAIALTPALAAP